MIYPNEPAYIMADPLKLKIAFTNIIINAIEAMKENKGELDISVTSQNGHHLVSIKDNGTGIRRKPFRIYSNLILHLKETAWAWAWLPPSISFNRIKHPLTFRPALNQGSNFILKFERA